MDAAGRSASSWFPVTGLPLEVHHCDDPHPLRLIQVDHRVGEDVREVPAGRRIEGPEAIGLTAHVLDHSLDFIVKASAQLWVYASVESGCLRVFLFRLGVKDMPLDRPTILPMRADTSSPGAPFTLPLSISVTRRRVSCFQASSRAGSILW